MSVFHTSPRLSRRNVLRGAVGLGALSAFGTTALTGCSSGGSATTKAGANTVTLPTYVPFEGPKPAFPSPTPGAPMGYTSYPAETVDSVTKPPLTKGMTAMTNIFLPLPTNKSDNPAWQEVEKRLGGSLDLTIVPASDYTAKFQTMLAGKKLPDVTLTDLSSVDNPPEFFNAVAADLTPYLSGDAVKDYPNLAAVPTICWQDCIADNKIFQIPIPRGLTGGSGFYNADLLTQAGVDFPKNTDEFYQVLKEVTDPKAGHWGIVNSKGNTFFVFIEQMFGVPLSWRLRDGKLQRSWETQEYADALEFGAKIVKDKLTIPGSDGISGADRKNDFISGKGAFVYDGLPAYPNYFKQMKGAARPLVPMGRPGKKPVTWYDNTSFGTTFLNKDNDESRVKELLGALDFFAAPFGTSEYTLLNYGVKGSEYAIDSHGSPELTDKGTRDLTVPWKYLSGPAQAVFDPNATYVKNYCTANAELIKTAVKNPCANLISPTQNDKGSSIDQKITDLKNDILAGRKPMSDWKPAVKQWAESGGDKIREEYQQALQANGAKG